MAVSEEKSPAAFLNSGPIFPEPLYFRKRPNPGKNSTLRSRKVPEEASTRNVSRTDLGPATSFTIYLIDPTQERKQ